MIIKVSYTIIIAALIGLAFFYLNGQNISIEKKPILKKVPIWEFRSIDTVKSSRDLASEMLNNPQFDLTINKQVADIAGTGVSHVAISTPYDAEFLPFLKRWVKAARANQLKVWFRGNFSGWEEWFSYSRISREQHKKLVQEFIEANKDIFEDGDIFTSCPECENGGPGDPRNNGDVMGHRKFLIEEYNLSKDSFEKIGKKVQPGFYSMNYDVAQLVMDEQTTDKLGNLIVIDHYIKNADQLAEDAKKIAEKAKGQVVLGEFGAPIPDIHGSLDEKAQAEWIKEALERVEKTPEVVGVNYWTNVGGSTAIWNSSGNKREAVDTIEKFYKSTKTIQIF